MARKTGKYHLRIVHTLSLLYSEQKEPLENDTHFAGHRRLQELLSNVQDDRSAVRPGPDRTNLEIMPLNHVIELGNLP